MTNDHDNDLAEGLVEPMVFLREQANTEAIHCYLNADGEDAPLPRPLTFADMERLMSEANRKADSYLAMQHAQIDAIIDTYRDGLVREEVGFLIDLYGSGASEREDLLDAVVVALARIHARVAEAEAGLLVYSEDARAQCLDLTIEAMLRDVVDGGARER